MGETALSPTVKASPDLRLQLARVLERHEGPWGPEELEMAHRVCRDPEGPVWAVGCRAVGARAVSEPGALQELCELLESPSAEIRLRGVWAMETLAREAQVEAAEFMVQRLEDPATMEDPVLLAGLLRMAAALPAEVGEGVLVFCMADPRADIRAAAVASLPDWDPWPRLLLLAADDPSPTVRAALGVALRFLPTSDEVDGVLEALAADPDPLVRFSVTEIYDEPGPVEDPPPPDPGLMDRARAVEDCLDADPTSWRAMLDRCLRWPDGREVLSAVAEVGRDPGVRGVARALGWLAADSRDSLAGANGALQGEAGRRCEDLARFVDVCARAAGCATPAQLGSWELKCRGLKPLSTHAGLGLDDLREVASRLAFSADRRTVTDALYRLDELERAARTWPAVERVVLQGVLIAWREMLEVSE